MHKSLLYKGIKQLFPFCASFLFLLIISSQLSAEILEPENPGGEGCYTQILYDLKYGHLKDPNACSPMGPCDDVGTRNAHIPDSTVPLKFIRIYFHVFRNDDGTNAAATEQNVIDAVADINADYLSLRIQFEYQMRFVNSSAYRYLTENYEFDQMKNAYAIGPDSQLNVFVASVNVGGEVYSYGTFPWDGACLTKTGGIVLNNTQFPPYNHRTLTHEIGHNLGLWHTFHGVSEVSECGQCYEPPNHPENDLRGDFCSDTEPAPRNWNCGAYGGNDPCEDTPWGTNEWHNHMSYSSCRYEFTPQQWGRMHCWTEDILSSWLNNVKFTADTIFGEVPLDVQFTGTTPKVVLDWNWEFGDGDIDDMQNPSHLYDEPGLYDVKVTINAEDGTYIT
ncbi:MAG: PKD domain-containing protein, partial [bacterium]